MDQPKQSPPGKKLGKGMWIAFWLVCLVMLTLFFAQQERSWLNPNQAPEYRTTAEGIQEVILTRNRQGHYIVSGSINGQKTDFLLDTGATDVVVSGNLANKFGLPRGARSYANTANGRITVYSTRIEQLSIGNITLHQVKASINPSMNDLVLLGMSALKQVELSQRGNTLTLKYHPY